MIGVVIPAHNEAECIGAALDAVAIAARHADLAGEQVRVMVILDACTDGTSSVVQGRGAEAWSIDAHCVGIARSIGANKLINEGARWLSFTDADSLVAPDWLAAQLALDCDVVCGCVGIADWSMHGSWAAALESDFRTHYVDQDGHAHIHGANLGVAVDAYRRAGGFQPLTCGEDVALVRALETSGARIAWSAAPRVTTSARVQARARGGFGDTLLRVVEKLSLAPEAALVLPAA